MLLLPFEMSCCSQRIFPHYLMFNKMFERWENAGFTCLNWSSNNSSELLLSDPAPSAKIIPPSDPSKENSQGGFWPWNDEGHCFWCCGTFWISQKRWTCSQCDRLKSCFDHYPSQQNDPQSQKSALGNCQRIWSKSSNLLSTSSSKAKLELSLWLPVDYRVMCTDGCMGWWINQLNKWVIIVQAIVAIPELTQRDEKQTGFAQLSAMALLQGSELALLKLSLILSICTINAP